MAHVLFYRYEYTLTREYNWNVKNKASKGYEVCIYLHLSVAASTTHSSIIILVSPPPSLAVQETYFFVVRPNEGIFYNEIETRYSECDVSVVMM